MSQASYLHEEPGAYSIVEMNGAQVLVYREKWIVELDGRGRIVGYRRFRP